METEIITIGDYILQRTEIQISIFRGSKYIDLIALDCHMTSPLREVMMLKKALNAVAINICERGIIK